MNQCEDCVYYVYDVKYENCICEADMDEDDYARLFGETGMVGRPLSSCPFYRDGDEYKVVRHQI